LPPSGPRSFLKRLHNNQNSTPKINLKKFINAGYVSEIWKLRKIDVSSKLRHNN
jgi:hypothetical protein